MTQSVPDGPTDPSLSAMREESTTIVTPGYGGPAVPPPPPYGPPGSPVAEPPVEPLAEPVTEAASGRVYSAGEGRYGPVTDPAVTDPGTPQPAAPEPAAGRGSTTIADDVVERIIEKVVRLTVAEVEGVSGLHAPPEAGAPSVSVRVAGPEATIDIAIQVDFGHAVHEVVEQVRARVIEQAQRLLGLGLVEVNVLVADVTFDAGEPVSEE